jgi:DNA-binding MarR family transcriptional regulator
MVMTHTLSPDLLTTRVREGFDRIAHVQRADLWAAAGEVGLNPTQAQVLGLLARRPGGLRQKEIAVHLAISGPSIADTVAALLRKALVSRVPDPSDARAAIVRTTAKGLSLGNRIAEYSSQLDDALASLPQAAQEQLLVTQVSIIRHLQEAGSIPLQRMCLSCRHFRPHAHQHAAKPHHCAFVDAAIGDRDLRLDCGEHEAADPVVQAATWMAFVKGPPPLQAKPSP